MWPAGRYRTFVTPTSEEILLAVHREGSAFKCLAVPCYEIEKRQSVWSELLFQIRLVYLMVDLIIHLQFLIDDSCICLTSETPHVVTK